MHESTYALAAIVIAIVTLISTLVSNRRSADKDHVNSVQERVTSNERRLTECEHDRTRLTGEVDRIRDENLFLMRRILDVERNVQIERRVEEVGEAARAAYSEANEVNRKLVALGESRAQAENVKRAAREQKP